MRTLTSTPASTPAARIALLGAAIAVAVTVAGCKPTTGQPIAATGGATSQSAAQNTAAGGSSPAHLLAVHDPRQVTGSAPTSCHALVGPRPDPKCTPGAIDPAVTQANIKSTICHSGYTSTVRPSASQTDRLKHAMYKSYGLPAGDTSELDHLVSLELGGANDAANLWPEVGKIPNPKDSVENDLHDAVCSGKVTLAAAQQAIASNWQTAEAVLGISHK